MKKATLAIVAVAILMASSCSKNNSSPTISGNSWLFKGSTYNTVTCAASGNVLQASSATGSNLSSFSTLQIQFPGSAMPATGGSYAVVSTVPGANQVNLNVTIGGTTPTDYVSTGNGSNQTVTVSVSNGKVTVAGTAIEMEIAGGGSDSSAMSFSVTQQ